MNSTRVGKVCVCGKIMYDKKGATTLVNMAMNLDHIKMRIYECPDSGMWHLSSIGKHKKFRTRVINYKYSTN